MNHAPRFINHKPHRNSVKDMNQYNLCSISTERTTQPTTTKLMVPTQQKIELSCQNSSGSSGFDKIFSKQGSIKDKSNQSIKSEDSIGSCFQFSVSRDSIKFYIENNLISDIITSESGTEFLLSSYSFIINDKLLNFSNILDSQTNLKPQSDLEILLFEQIKDKLFDFCTNKHASQVIQCIITNTNNQQILKTIQQSLCENFQLIGFDPFGSKIIISLIKKLNDIKNTENSLAKLRNYFDSQEKVQRPRCPEPKQKNPKKLIKYFNNNLKFHNENVENCDDLLLNLIKNGTKGLAVSMLQESIHSCDILNYILNNLDYSYSKYLVWQLSDNLPHITQKKDHFKTLELIFRKFKSHNLSFLYRAIRTNLLKISTNPFGNLFIQKIISLPDQFKPDLFSDLHISPLDSNILDLHKIKNLLKTQNPCKNSVNPANILEILKLRLILCDKFMSLSFDKYGSHVFEKLLFIGLTRQEWAIFTKGFYNYAESLVPAMADSKISNYVLQTVLSVSKNNIDLFEAIKTIILQTVHRTALERFSYGNKISKLLFN